MAEKGFGSFQDAFKNFKPLKENVEKRSEEEKPKSAEEPLVGRKAEILEEGLTPEDEKLLRNLRTALSLRGKSYWGVSRAIKDSYKHDVSFELDRWIDKGRMISQVPDLLRAELITGLYEVKGRGFTAEAKTWLQSLTQEGMRYGRREPGQSERDVKEYRLAQAQVYADKAYRSLEDIAKEGGFDIDELMQ